MGNVTITVAGDERLQRVSPFDALPDSVKPAPDWVLAKIGTGAPVTFRDDDQLGRELLRRWRAALEPAASVQEYWGIMGALAWIATRDMELARRAAIFDCACIGRPKVQPKPSRPGVMRLGRQTQPRGDGRRRHEWAVLAHEVFAHCTVQRRGGDWRDCRCLDRAVDQLRSAIDAIEVDRLRGYAWIGEATRRELAGADFIGLHREVSGLPWLAVANGIRRIEFDAKKAQGFKFPKLPAKRGRRKGSGKDDLAALDKMVELITNGGVITINAAAVQAAPLAYESAISEPDTVRRRLVDKYNLLVLEDKALRPPLRATMEN